MNKVEWRLIFVMANVTPINDVTDICQRAELVVFPQDGSLQHKILQVSRNTAS